jgi:hypothetical protein
MLNSTRGMTALKRRTPITPIAVTVGGLRRILRGVFGTSQPGDLSDEVQVGPGYFHFHRGDLFSPGTGNWVYEPTHETPLMTAWGHAFLRRANVFRPLQPPPVQVFPSPFAAGLAGIVVGGIELENLMANPPVTAAGVGEVNG